MKLFFTTVFVFILLSSLTLAADWKPFSKISSHPDFINQIKMDADKNFPTLKDENGQVLSPVTPSEATLGIVPVQALQRVVDRGIFNGFARFCGYETESNQIFNDSMMEEAKKKTWTKRQLMYMSLAMGITTGVFLKKLEQENTSCPDKTKAGVKDYLIYLEGGR